MAGVRIFYMDAKGIVQTMLLAVKHFRPAPSLGKVTGQVVMLWVCQVLAQNGLHEKDISGAVTDSGGDVRTGVREAFDREWCIPHMSTMPPSTAPACRRRKKPRRTYSAAAYWSFARRSSRWPTGLLPSRYSSKGFVVWYMEWFCGGCWTVWILVEQYSEYPTPKAHQRGRVHAGLVPRRDIFCKLRHPPPS